MVTHFLIRENRWAMKFAIITAILKTKRPARKSRENFYHSIAACDIGSEMNDAK